MNDDDDWIDPMQRLLRTIEAAKEFGCEHDKSFAWEGLAILAQDQADDWHELPSDFDLTKLHNDWN